MPESDLSGQHDSTSVLPWYEGLVINKFIRAWFSHFESAVSERVCLYHVMTSGRECLCHDSLWSCDDIRKGVFVSCDDIRKGVFVS